MPERLRLSEYRCRVGCLSFEQHIVLAPQHTVLAIPEAPQLYYHGYNTKRPGRWLRACNRLNAGPHKGRTRVKTIHYLASAALVSLIVGSFSGQVMAQDADLIEKAKKEGKVTYYTTRLIASMNEMSKAFEAKYGIKVEASRHTNEDLIAKIVNETKAGRASADVFDGSSGITTLMDQGLVASYKPKQAEVFDSAYKDPAGHWTAVQLFVAGLSYNKDLVKAADVPKTVDDLLDPKWHGRKITYTMQFTVSGINGFYGALEKERGPEKAREFIAKLHKQGAVAQNVTPGGTADQLASGQFPLCLYPVVDLFVFGGELIAEPDISLALPVVELRGSITFRLQPFHFLGVLAGDFGTGDLESRY